VIGKALADTDALIDSYLALRYQVPLAAAPGRVVDLACTIARYRLHENRATDRIRDDYTEALAFLRDVAQGRAAIPGLTERPPTGDGSASGVPNVNAPAVTFTDRVLGAMP
jgi:phage gp36-like protein